MGVNFNREEPTEEYWDTSGEVRKSAVNSTSKYGSQVAPPLEFDQLTNPTKSKPAPKKSSEWDLEAWLNDDASDSKTTNHIEKSSKLAMATNEEEDLEAWLNEDLTNESLDDVKPADESTRQDSWGGDWDGEWDDLTDSGQQAKRD